MRTLLLATLTFLFMLPAMGQDCRYDINKVDKFTDDITQLTRTEKVWKGFYEEEFLTCAAVRENEQRGLLVAYYAHEEYKIEEGDSLMLLLDNNEIMILEASKDRLAERYSDKIYFAKVFYPVDKEKMAVLTAHPVTAVRQYYKGGYFERDIKEKKRGSFMELLGCIQ